MLEKLINGKEKLAVVGMGYVGLPLAIAFSEKNFNVIGFDINQTKIEKYLNGEDPTNEVGDERIKNSKNIEFTSDEIKLKEAKFIIVAVPTPVLENKMPDLRPLEGASTVIGRNLSKGTIVVYESTVYPGATEEVCLPILEKESGLKCGIDFKIGYSPERINPADKVNTLTKIMKITSGMDKESSDIIAGVYSQVITAGIHRASSIKVAEAAKVIENSQRDINIAFVNELSLIFDRIGIDTLEVLEAAGTKWNFLPYRPGLVGGHCIGVDPYYLANKASELGYHAQVILAGRRINDNMAKFVAEKTIKKLINDNIRVKGADILVMGLTFKENCPDLRNSKVNDIIMKITSGMDKESSDIIADIYSQVITAGIHRASSIKVAEAAKVIENSQRDINIAFINELSLIFDRIGIDTLEVLEAAGTKWNFLPYRPGLVGGHCIGVDPYYLANKASELGYHAQVILAGRRINDNMAKFVAEKTIKKLINDNIRVKGADILVMGLTFKENCPDLRNSKVNDIIKELREYGANVHIVDPMAPKEEALEEYGIILEDESCIKNMDAVVVAVGHKEYRDMKPADLRKYFNPVYAKPLLIDVKSIFNKAEAEKEYDYWRL